MDNSVKSKVMKKEKEIINDDIIDTFKALTYSTIGIIIFFIPINIHNQTATIIYHIVDKIQLEARNIIEVSIIIYTTIGSLKSFINYKDKKLSIKKIYVYLKMISILIILNIFYGKSIILIDDTTSLIINETILNIATILPVSSIFITFILDYGLLEIIESYFQKSMKSLFKLSGKSILNILIYLFTDYFCGFFVTNKLYKQGKIRNNEACIIFLNFSILSIPMSIYVTEELDLNKFEFFIITTFILFISNFILCRIYPLNKKKKSYFIKTNYKETLHKDKKFKRGLNQYLKNRDKKNIFINIANNLEESINLAMNLIPNITIILYISSILINNGLTTNIFKNIFYPLVKIFKLSNYGELSKFFVNLFFNNIIAINALDLNIEYSTKFLIGVILISICISLSTSIICICNMNIKLSIKELILLYLEKIIIIVIIFSFIYYFYLGFTTNNYNI